MAVYTVFLYATCVYVQLTVLSNSIQCTVLRGNRRQS